MIPALKVESNHGETEYLREAEEKKKKKVVTLRSGLCGVFSRHDIDFGKGISGEDLIHSVAQLLGKPKGANYAEQLHIGWCEEYRQLVQSIGLMTHNEFGLETSPQEVLTTIEQQLNGSEWQSLSESV